MNNLLYVEENNTLGFGEYTLAKKSKVEDFEYQGDLYKVKTFSDITKLEKNGLFVYESVPGTKVNEFSLTDSKMCFIVSGQKVAQITVGLEPEKEYAVTVGEKDLGVLITNVSGKLSLVVDVETCESVKVSVEKQ